MIQRLLLFFLTFCASAGLWAENLDLSGWSQLPVQHNGRIMPMDSFARNVLLGLSGKSSFEGKPAAEWLAHVLFTPEQASNDKIFLINDPEVLESIGLPADGRGRHSAAELKPRKEQIRKLALEAMGKQEEAGKGSLSTAETELMRLLTSLNLYDALATAYPFASALASAGDDKATQLELIRQPEYRSTMRRGGPPAIVPPAGRDEERWMSPYEALLSRAHPEWADPLVSLVTSYRASNAAGFNRACDQLAALSHDRVSKAYKLGQEVLLNRIDPLYRAEICYGIAFLLAMTGLILTSRWIPRAAASLVVIGLLLHTYGIVMRMVIMDRPPVTNLYSTFVFVAWACALLGLVMEWMQRNRLGLLIAATSGLVLLLTAGGFDDNGDTMGVMAAVLDSNFWLATHVITISLGYAGCVVSGLLGHIYLIETIRRPHDEARLKQIFGAVYGTQAFGLVLSFAGTMLGGVWADQSWGRFWGWDPKENGALVIVLWSSIIFHARLGRMIGPLGFAAGSVIGVVTVLMAWLGVNLLGVGLHSYGFTSGVATSLFGISIAEVVFIAAALPWAKGRSRLQTTTSAT